MNLRFLNFSTSSEKYFTLSSIFFNIPMPWSANMTLKSIPEDLYESSAIDGANYWQKLFYISLPMMKNIISITILFSIIVTFANFDIVRVLTRGGPIDTTHLFATYAFRVGIESGDIPLGAAVSLFMFPVLAVLSFIILRNVRKRSNEV